MVGEGAVVGEGSGTERLCHVHRRQTTQGGMGGTLQDTARGKGKTLSCVSLKLL